MILYCDTSSLVKLYVEEAHSETVRGLVRNADLVATSQVALPELVSALTRRYNAGQLDHQTYKLLLQTIRKDWQHVVSLSVDEQLAADLAERHGLRGFDAVHLASAVHLAGQKGVVLAFSAFDAQLVSAAAAEGLGIV